jgi:predicted ester cyclase
MKTDILSQLRKANAALLERGETEVIGDYFSPDYVAHITGKDITGGHKVIRQIVAMYQKAFGEITTSMEILVQQDDRVAWQRTIHATQHGAFKGFPATKRPIVWREMVTSRFEDGRIVEEWFITDLAEQLLLSRKGNSNVI